MSHSVVKPPAPSWQRNPTRTTWCASFLLYLARVPDVAGGSVVVHDLRIERIVRGFGMRTAEASDETIQVSFSAAGHNFSYMASRVDVFADNATIVVNSGNTTRAEGPAAVPVYEADDGDSWIVFELDNDDIVSGSIARNGQSFSLTRAADLPEEAAEIPADATASSLIMVESTDDGLELDDMEGPLGEDGTDDDDDAEHHHHGRRLQVGMLPSGPPYGRLTYCPESGTRQVTLGMVCDYNFVKKVGGQTKTMNYVASMIASANNIYGDQVGVKFYVKRLVVNDSYNIAFEQSGPNPTSEGSGRNKCPGIKDGSRATVELTDGSDELLTFHKGHQLALQWFGMWVDRHAPANGEDVALWHWLTNCFPGPGVVGVAWMKTACTSGTTLKFGDAGQKCEGCSYELANGNKATSYYGVGYCKAGRKACYGRTSISSWISGSNSWRIFAHEVRPSPPRLPSAKAGMVAPRSPTSPPRPRRSRARPSSSATTLAPSTRSTGAAS